MTMTPAEIAKSYREAKDRRAQIGVLADLNACKKPDILAALVEAGELTPEDAVQLQPKKPSRPSRKTPAPAPAADPPREGYTRLIVEPPAPQEPTGALFYGRPFSGRAVRMDELNLDMFRVIVEGKVFAVQHRELKKRGAWVVCFDMTDYTSSVRVNQFMEAAKAKPIIDNVQAGIWLRVQGKMSFDRYDNEMVLQPTAM